NSLSSCGGVSQVDCMRLTWNTATQVQGTVRIAVGGGSGCGGIGIGIGEIAIATTFPCMSPPSSVDATVSGTVVTPLPGCSSLLSCLTGSESVNDKSANHLDVVPYKTDVPSVYEKHHGVVDVWARNNISGYDRMQAPA